MASYVVLIPQGAEAGNESAVVQRDGFAWLAFIAPVLWFLWHRMWLWAALYLIIGFGVAFAVERTDWGVTAVLLGLLANLWAGLEAGGLRAADLRSRGWTASDVIVAPDRMAAEAIHFGNVGERADTGHEPPAPPINPRQPPSRDDGPALGLFDYD